MAASIYIIKKEREAAIFKIVITKSDITRDQLIDQWELAAPIYRHEGFTCNGITIGVKPGSAFVEWGNGVASELFGRDLWGEVVFTFEEIEEEMATMPIIHAHLLKLGMDAKSIKFGDEEPEPLSLLSHTFTFYFGKKVNSFE